MPITIRDEISGKPVVIENPLLAEHVEVGRFLAYSGYTSVGQWNCPAVITKVDRTKKQFRVRSLDDMIEQDQWYGFSTENDHTGSRSTMRLIERPDVDAYLERRRESLTESVEEAKRDVVAAEAKLATFDKNSKMLGFAKEPA